MSLADELRPLLGSDAIADDPETLAAHSGDKWFAAEIPEVVVFARSATEVSKLLKFATAKKIPPDLVTSAVACRQRKVSRSP